MAAPSSRLNSPLFEEELGFPFATNFLFPAAGLLNYR
jgi:hypothetical protein